MPKVYVTVSYAEDDFTTVITDSQIHLTPEVVIRPRHIKLYAAIGVHIKEIEALVRQYERDHNLSPSFKVES